MKHKLKKITWSVWFWVNGIWKYAK
jgi:hypothetical protein